MRKAMVILMFTLTTCGATPRARAASRADIGDEHVKAAIVGCVRARMDSIAAVTVDDLRVRWSAPTVRVRAVPDAGAKIGGPIRFLLFDANSLRPRRAGAADATVRVVATHLRARVVIARGASIVAEDVEPIVADLGRVPMLPLPKHGEIRGAIAKRDIAPGETIVSSVLQRAPAVRSGDEVRTVVRMGLVEAAGRAVAAETASLGEMVRVVINRRSLVGRVVGSGEVEIVP